MNNFLPKTRYKLKDRSTFTNTYRLYTICIVYIHLNVHVCEHTHTKKNTLLKNQNFAWKLKFKFKLLMMSRHKRCNKFESFT